MSYEESLADITDKTQLEWREVYLNHHGFITAEKW